MPSAHDLISDVDEFRDTPAPPPVRDTLPVAVPAKKNKRKGKKHVGPKPQKWDDEDTPYPKSVTPSPPVSHDVKLDVPSFSPQLADLGQNGEESREEQDMAWEDDTTAPEDPESQPKPSPVASPTVRSPRPAAAMPASPPYRTPSLHQSPQYSNVIGHRPNSSTDQPSIQQRRTSFATQHTSPRPRFAQLSPQPQARYADPPPPHMPQPHFYGVPDIPLPLSQNPEIARASGPSSRYCCFDSFADAGDSVTAKKARDVLLLGFDDALEVYRVLPDKMEVVGRLEGLRGAVVGAKVLPHSMRYDFMQHLRPLVALIIHGPTVLDRSSWGGEFDTPQDQTQTYQTTVEIYSLQSQQHIATLFKTSTIRVEPPAVGHLSLPPKPVGELSVAAAGKFITVTSGKSGEVFIFSDAPQQDFETPKFRCIGKIWTAIQQRSESSAPASTNETENSRTSQRLADVPLIALHGRWLAVVPPYTSAGLPIQGTPLLLESNPQPLGINTSTAPPQPAITCEVAGVDSEGTLSWLSRKAAQGLVMASQKGIEMGKQGWKELTHPSPPSARPSSHHRSSSHEPSLFPPTNAPADDPRRLAKEPAIVSILDLDRFLVAEQQKSKQVPMPLATFALVDGCNFLSFSPDGLRLLTSNRRGEISTVWDLTHIAHGTATITQSEDDDIDQRPHLKQIHRIARSSPSVTIESAWSRDGGWLAVLTAHGTVHLHEIPLTPPGKKRKRRSTLSAPPSEKAEATVSVSQGMSPPSSSGLLGSFRSWSQSMTTQANALKTQYALPTTFAGFRETAAAAGIAGRKAVARGLGQGYSAAKSGASDMWHAEENKIRMKVLQEVGARSGCLMWIQRQMGSAIAIISATNVSLHAVERVTRHKGDLLVSGLKREKSPRNFALPVFDRVKDGSAGGAGKGCSDQGPHGFWSLRSPAPDDALSKAAARKACPSRAAANEVETNPPYCPFHVDHRVSIYAFNDSVKYSSQINETAIFDFKTRGHGFLEHEGQWLFGEPLPPSVKVNESPPRPPPPHPHLDEEGMNDAAEYAGTVDEEFLTQVESRLLIRSGGEGGGEEQIHVNSRRSRRRAGKRGDARRRPGLEEGEEFSMLEEDDYRRSLI